MPARPSPRYPPSDASPGRVTHYKCVAGHVCASVPQVKPVPPAPSRRVSRHPACPRAEFRACLSLCLVFLALDHHGQLTAILEQTQDRYRRYTLNLLAFDRTSELCIERLNRLPLVCSAASIVCILPLQCHAAVAFYCALAPLKFYFESAVGDASVFFKYSESLPSLFASSNEHSPYASLRLALGPHPVPTEYIFWPRLFA